MSRLTCVAAGVLMGLSPLAPAATITDNFNTAHNYATSGTSGTLWTGILNSGNLATGNTTTNSGQLTWGVTADNVGWEGPNGGKSNAPLLYRDVKGDFVAIVKVISQTQGNGSNLFSSGGLIVRVPTLSDAGSGEDYVSVNSDLHNFRNAVARRTVDNGVQASDSNLANSTSSAFPRWIQLERAGNTFYTRYSVNGTTWSEISVVRADMGAIETLQVGLHYGTYHTGDGQIVFDDFSLTGANVPEPTGALALTCGGLLLLRRRRA